jgi:methanethiol oxidase
VVSRILLAGLEQYKGAKRLRLKGERAMSQSLDPTFYRTPADAIAAPPERLAYVAAFDPTGRAKDAMTVIDSDPASSTYGQVVGWTELPTGGNELHHFGWNACSSALCHQGHGDGGQPLERRYLVVPGLRSSRIYVLDTKPDPRNPRVVREIEAEELAAKAGYSRPHTVHCGPGGIFLFSLGGANGNDGPGGVALLDHDTFDVVGAWELDRGDQYFAYDGWWHLDHDTMITSEWGTPSMLENGLNPEDFLGRRFGHHLNFWSMSERKLTQRVDLGDQHQMVLEVRPAHDPSKAWGFVGAVISVEDLSGSVWLWHRDGDRWALRKVVTIPAEPADPATLPPALQPFGAVPPLISDIDLSVDDRWLYVACWGTGELKQYDVSDPFNPRETGSVKLGGIVRRQPHPAAPDQPLAGGPQMVEISRNGKRVYLTNSLYAAWDDIFYPDGVGAWMAKLDADQQTGGLAVDPRFFPNGDDFRGLRVHQTRLQAGDASSDSYCYTS